MPRHLVIGNDQLLITFDEALNVRDLYYPHVGMPNHLMGHKNSIGVWCEKGFSWLYEPWWDKRVGYKRQTLVGDCRAVHRGWGLALRLFDAVHYRLNVHLKRILVRNEGDWEREIRVFFTHDFSINGIDVGDTALYDPTLDAIKHYKGDCCFLIKGQVGRQGIYQYATGTKRFRGAEGTWRDAEDGVLEGNPIAQGSVDSTISFRLKVGPREERELTYWLAAGRGFEEVRHLNHLVEEGGVASLMRETQVYWFSWANKGMKTFPAPMEEYLPPRIIELYKRSLLTIRTQMDASGAILAANDTDILQFNRDHYSYMWPRDGALVAHALSQAGYPELARRFFAFCGRVLSTGGFLWHKYNPDGSVGSSWHPWMAGGEPVLPIQEDETALVLFALGHYYEKERDLEFIESLYRPFIRQAADFLFYYRDLATKLPLESYDLWEERRGIFTFTTAAVYAGLMAAGKFARLFGHVQIAHQYEQAAKEMRRAMIRYLFDPRLGRFIRGVYRDGDRLIPDPTLESSLYGLFGLGVFSADDERIVRTMEAVAEGLWVKTSVGGLARYNEDPYLRAIAGDACIPGNPWVICTLWWADYHIARAKEPQDLEKARRLLHWVVDHALDSGLLPEQLHPQTGSPISVTPLTWSHSTYVLTVVKYLAKRWELEERRHLAQAWHTSPWSG
ncbi:MAG: glycoside hydrolase family 15 protein [Limnochordia bacterium]